MLYGGTIASGRSCKGEDLDIVSTFEVPCHVFDLHPLAASVAGTARHMESTLLVPSQRRRRNQVWAQSCANVKVLHVITVYSRFSWH